jgi:hypothetical protein
MFHKIVEYVCMHVYEHMECACICMYLYMHTNMIFTSKQMIYNENSVQNRFPQCCASYACINGKGAACRPSATSRPNDYQKFFTSLQPGYSEGSDHTLQGLRWHLYLFIAGILKALACFWP